MKVPIQTGPTCWFHALLFHLLCVPSIREKIKRLMNEYIRKLPDNKKNAFYVYPDTNEPSKYNLFRYIWHILHETAPNQIQSNRLIHAAFKKYNFNLKSHSHSGTQKFLPILCHRLGLNVDFVSQESTNAPKKNIVVYTRKNIFEHRGQTANNSFELLYESPVGNGYTFHSHLMSVKAHGKSHAIVGFYMNNKPYIADSHYSKLIPLDFTNSENVMSFYKQLGYNKVVYRNSLYTKQ